LLNNNNKILFNNVFDLSCLSFFPSSIWFFLWARALFFFVGKIWNLLSKNLRRIINLNTCFKSTCFLGKLNFDSQSMNSLISLKIIPFNFPSIFLIFQVFQSWVLKSKVFVLFLSFSFLFFSITIIRSWFCLWKIVENFVLGSWFERKVKSKEKQMIKGSKNKKINSRREILLVATSALLVRGKSTTWWIEWIFWNKSKSLIE